MEGQFIEMPSDWENIPYNKASLYLGSFNVYFTVIGYKNIVHCTDDFVMII